RTMRLDRLISITCVMFGITLIGVQRLLANNIAAKPAVVFLYAWTDMMTTIAVLQFWLMAGSVFNTRQAKRLFGALGTGASIGSIIVVFASATLVELYGANMLSLGTAVLMLLCVGTVSASHKHVPSQ